MRVELCIPVFNDWTSALALLGSLDDVASKSSDTIGVWLVDDGSFEEAPALTAPFRALASVSVLRLRANLGHQRAIAVGLCHLYERKVGDAIVVMDGDGEDDPSDLPKLIERLRANAERAIVFAKRTKRTERFGFRAGYLAFKVLHGLLTGRPVEVGNFSIIPRAALAKIVGISEIWNHYAAAVHHARLPIETIPLPRATRIAGESKMNTVALVTHGLSAISVYSETVGVRLLFGLSAAIVSVLAGAVGIAVLRFGTDLAIPGWATTASGIALITVLNLMILCGGAVLTVLQSRTRAAFIPLRDYKHFISDEVSLFERGSQASRGT